MAKLKGGKKIKLIPTIDCPNQSDTGQQKNQSKNFLNLNAEHT